MTRTTKELIMTLRATANRASEAIIEVYNKDIEVEIKEHQSLLTLTDQRASDITLSDLAEAYPRLCYPV